MNQDAEQIDDLCDAFEQAWQNGDDPEVTQWLNSAPGELQMRLLPELVRLDIEYRQARDPDFSVDGYLQRLGLSGRNHSSDPTLTLQTSRPVANRPVGPSERHLPQNHVAHFRIDHELGRGGFGIVYRAYDTVLDRDVALKIPKDQLTERVRQQFLQEAKATAALDHPGLVPVYAAGEASGVCYIATAYCEGMDLARWMKSQQAIPVTHAAAIVRDLAEAMQHAHNRGIVHRDLKPSNVMAVPQNSDPPDSIPQIVPRITDFGLATIQENNLTETHSSIAIGTPGYMAPEQMGIYSEYRLRPSVDIHALGVILHELLIGDRPYERRTIIEVMDAIRKDPVIPLRQRNASVPIDLETICLKCLAKSPCDRYQTCAELAEDLSRFLRGEPILARPPGLKKRLSRWLTSPDRIQEAGLLSIVLGLGVPAWIAFIIALVAAEDLQADFQQELIPQTLLISGLLLFPLAWCGYRTLDASRRWIQIGFVASIINVIMVCPPLFGHVFVFPELYARYPLGRIIGYSLLTMMFVIQVLQYGILVCSAKHRPKL